MIIVKVEKSRNKYAEKKYAIWNEKRKEFFKTDNLKEFLWTIERDILKAERKLNKQ